MESRIFLESLSNESGVSGYEANLNDLISSEFQKYTDETRIDNLGNIISIKKGKGNVIIMLAAHMDEIGLMINYIEENGLLRFTSVGGFDPRTIVGQEVIVHGKEKILGIIGSKPPHLQEESEQDKSIKMEEMIIDIGYPYDKVKELVKIGDVVTIKRNMEVLKNNRVTGKALDNRAGVVVLLECAKELQKINHEANVYFVSTVQEEVSMGGATVASYSIDPDIGIAVDVGFGYTPELDEASSIKLGQGPGITLGGNIHPNLRKELIEVANKYNIPYQNVITPGPTGTDANAMQVNRAGIPALVLSVPLRYMHTSVELIQLDDIKYTAQLLAFFISLVSDGNLEGLLCY